ncbi:hypothetical protein RHMOL_Rhmol01G0221700 [Rhododendron molle]|uniref:Uncharacterized protein n=1 Tax=Rhododendron molle TaxID=49168 RepID=A0ACC0Q7L2_RHOML|nr:hypothetical protein RHMOL_Rhmol01G0221700 [Rhododendron molle]
MEQTLNVAIFPIPGMGHLIPLGEFAKRLVLTHKFSVTFIVPTLGPLSAGPKSFLDSLPTRINHVLLPPVNLDDLSSDVRAETAIALTVSRSLPSLHDVLKSLVSSSRVVALVVDLFATDAFDVAAEFGISPYIFFASTAMTLSLFLYLPKLHESVSCEYRDLAEPVQIPGCTPVHGKDLLDPVQDRKNDAYERLLHIAKQYSLAEGIIVNSFRALEGGAIKALQEEESGKPPVYPIGPLVRMDGADDGSECLRWLDDQPRGSVLFVAFGSLGTLSFDQLTELAFGLEMTEQRFLWVVRSPNDKVALSGVNDQNDPMDFLPNEFLDRTKGFGLVVPSWAPQVQILSHGSTGGFLTHCGWNSTLESVVNGVPLIAWPLYAEQNMNVVILTEDLKVAVRPKVGENGIIGRAEIVKVVKGLTEGEEGNTIHSRMKGLKDAAGMVLSEDGDSTKSLTKLAQKWKNKILN